MDENKISYASGIVKNIHEYYQNKVHERLDFHTTLLICGRKGSSKSTILNRSLFKNEDIPAPTYGIGYEHTSHTDEKKNICFHSNYYEIPIDGSNLKSLISAILPPNKLLTTSIILCVNLSDPSHAYTNLYNDLEEIKNFVSQRFQQFVQSRNKDYLTVVARCQKRWRKHSERKAQLEKVTSELPLPILVIGTHADVVIKKQDEDARKTLVAALRSLSENYGAMFATTGLNNKKTFEKVKHVVKAFTAFGTESTETKENVEEAATVNDVDLNEPLALQSSQEEKKSSEDILSAELRRFIDHREGMLEKIGHSLYSNDIIKEGVFALARQPKYDNGNYEKHVSEYAACFGASSIETREAKKVAVEKSIEALLQYKDYKEPELDNALQQNRNELEILIREKKKQLNLFLDVSNKLI